MCDRVAEIRQDAVAEEARDLPTVPQYRVNAGLVVPPQRIEEVLRLHPFGEAGGIHEIEKGQREGAPLGDQAHRVGRRVGSGEGLPEADAVTEGKTEFMQLSVGQLRELIRRDTFSTEGSHVVAEANLMQPYLNAVHCGFLLCERARTP